MSARQASVDPNQRQARCLRQSAHFEREQWEVMVEPKILLMLMLIALLLLSVYLTALPG